MTSSAGQGSSWPRRVGAAPRPGQELEGATIVGRLPPGGQVMTDHPDRTPEERQSLDSSDRSLPPGAIEALDETVFVSSVRLEGRDPWAQVIGLTEKACDDAADALIESWAEGTYQSAPPDDLRTVEDYARMLRRSDARPMLLSELVLTAEQYVALKGSGCIYRGWISPH